MQADTACNFQAAFGEDAIKAAAIMLIGPRAIPSAHSELSRSQSSSEHTTIGARTFLIVSYVCKDSRIVDFRGENISPVCPELV